jgi:hypothetical protein
MKTRNRLTLRRLAAVVMAGSPAVDVTRSPHFGRASRVIAATLLSVTLFQFSLLAAGNDQNAARSKVFVSEVSGEAQIHIGDRIEPLVAKSTYLAEGCAIETMPGAHVTLVFSNGTSMALDPSTRIVVKQFLQEPFKPGRTDMDVEPSISRVTVVVTKGTIAISASTLVAGSNMVFMTPLAEISTRSREFVIEVTDDHTKVAMLAGESMVRGTSVDLAGAGKLQLGEQTIVYANSPTKVDTIAVTKISTTEAVSFDDKVATATMAKKSVYFEVKTQTTQAGGQSSSTASTGVSATTSSSSSGDAAASSSAPISAFDGNSAVITTTTSNTRTELVAVPVVPVELPVPFTVSPAQLGTAGKPGGG